jgi:hypothetical protein
MSCYKIYDYGDRLAAGKELRIDHSIYADTGSEEYMEKAQGLLALSDGELQKRRGISAEKEQQIYAKFKPLLAEWGEHATQTALMDRIIHYNGIKPSENTGNKWVTNEYGRHEISNNVYHMWYDVRDYRDNVFYVSWHIYTNAPRLESNYSQNIRIAGQENKRFTDRAGAEKYMEGRKKAYAHLFTETSPPIPEEYERVFTADGLPMKGYRAARTAKAREVAA